MSSRIERFFSRTELRAWLPRFFAVALLVLFCAVWLIADEQPASPDLTVHEWGTFTAVAGANGKAVEWTPLTGSTDLPGFVEHFSNANYKLGLRGTIRMETPVVYFYCPRDTTVSVKVAFSKGVITEWYPHAVRIEPSGVLANTSLSQLRTDGSIAWNGVAISPNMNGKFRREAQSSRYYSARDTSSAPLRVNTAEGDQQEKFLFYRGVSAVPLPLTAKQNAAGELLVQSLDENQIPTIILFERRGERVGYRLVRAPGDETMIEPPSLTGSLDSLCDDLQGILVEQGLYSDEAHAMAETWRDSWFEEGSRLIYIVPRAFVDKILPLAVNPAPSQVVRVFVGRLEIVTPATARAVATALASGDEVTLGKYGRFLEPILQTVREQYLETTQEQRNGR